MKEKYPFITKMNTNDVLRDLLESNDNLDERVTDLEESGGGTEVIANPTLAGTEDALEGLQVGDTKYKVSGHLYEHNIRITLLNYYLAGNMSVGQTYTSRIFLKIITDSNTEINTRQLLFNNLDNKERVANGYLISNFTNTYLDNIISISKVESLSYISLNYIILFKNYTPLSSYDFIYSTISLKLDEPTSGTFTVIDNVKQII